MKFYGMLLLCVAVSVGWWLGQQSSSMAQPQPVAERVEQPLPAVLPAERLISTLPPEHVPLASVLGTLEERARAGDTVAAFRLHLELDRCRTQRILRQAAASGRSAATAALARPQAAREMQSCLTEQICAGVSALQEAGWMDWLVLAALAGDPQARWRFAEGRFLNTSELAALQHAPLYRQQALHWMQELARQGHAGALVPLAHAYLYADDVMQPPLAQLVEQDRIHGVALLHAYVRSRGVAEVPLERVSALAPASAITAAEHAAAVAAGEDFYRRHLQDPAVPAVDMAPRSLHASPQEIALRAPQCLRMELEPSS